jgi:hypothetical protein
MAATLLAFASRRAWLSTLPICVCPPRTSMPVIRPRSAAASPTKRLDRHSPMPRK